MGQVIKASSAALYSLYYHLNCCPLTPTSAVHGKIVFDETDSWCLVPRLRTSALNDVFSRMHNLLVACHGTSGLQPKVNYSDRLQKPA